MISFVLAVYSRPLKFPNAAIFLAQTAASPYGLAPPQERQPRQIASTRTVLLQKFEVFRCGRKPAREEEPLDNLGLVNDRPGEYRDGELVGFGLAMRRERTVDNHFSTGRERTRYVGADLTGHAINCL